MGWREEFAGRHAVYDVPESIIRLEGLEDLSWHNDACPSFGVQLTEGLDLRIWCEAVDYDDRETGCTERFQVQAYAWDDSGFAILDHAGLPMLSQQGDFYDKPGATALDDVHVFSTDDPVEATRIFLSALVRLQAARRAA